MLKYAFNFAIETSFVRKLAGNESVKRFCFRNGKLSTRNYCSQAKFNSRFDKTHFAPPVYQRYKFLTNKGPVILLSGLLTFLGLKEKSPEEKEAEVVMMIKKGILYMQRQQFDKAEEVLHAGLKLAQDTNDADGITYIYDMLANMAFETGQHEKAEKLFVVVLQRLLANGEAEDSNKVIHISLKLAKIFESVKDLKKAEQGYQFCLDTLDKKLQEADEDTLALWGMSMDWYGRFLLGINKKTDALACFKKAYDMCVKVNGLEHEQTVVLLNDLGTVSSLVGDTESAVSYLEEARDIGNKLPEMKDLASIYINLGQLYLLREMYKESKVACQEGLHKAKTYEDHVAFSEAMHCLENIDKALKGAQAPKEIKVKQALAA